MLAVSFLNSTGTGIVTSGIFFLTDQAYGFTKRENYLLGLVLGVTVVFGALGAKHLVSVLRRRLRLPTRGVLIGVMLGMAALCTLPMAAKRFAPDDRSLNVASVWILVAAYSTLCGVLWPIIESFLSGARSGESLRRSAGIWNATWSSALVLTYWIISPLIKHHAAETILALGLVHLVCIPVIARFGPEPGEHLDEHHPPRPLVYRKLLVTFRVLLPTSYLVSSTLGPYLPTAMTHLHVPEHWHATLGSVWLLFRSITFFSLQRWHGWYGRWATAIVGGVLVLAGFGLCVMAPTMTPAIRDPAAVAVLLIGLAVFGTGMATIYTAAIYYALSSGQAEVDAGGKHEALVGTGYTLGPLCGLAASAAGDQGWIAPGQFNLAVLGTVGAIAVLVTIGVAVRVARVGRE